MKTEVSTYPMVTEVVGLVDRALGQGSEAWLGLRAESVTH